MIQYILYALIGLFLIYGSFSDMRSRRVSNKISFLIIFISLPLVVYNSFNFKTLHAFVILALFLGVFMRSIGPADAKVMITLVLFFTEKELTYFFAFFVFVFAFLIWRYGNNAPLFVGITSSYIFVFVPRIWPIFF